VTDNDNNHRAAASDWLIRNTHPTAAPVHLRLCGVEMRKTEQICDRCGLTVTNTDDAKQRDRCQQGGVDRKTYTVERSTVTIDVCSDCDKAIMTHMDDAFVELQRFCKPLAVTT
jgi:hypothetical protein